METSVKKTFPVTGLSCASCAISVKSVLKAQVGLLNASVNYANSSAWVEYDPKTTDCRSSNGSKFGIGSKQ